MVVMRMHAHCGYWAREMAWSWKRSAGLHWEGLGPQLTSLVDLLPWAWRWLHGGLYRAWLQVLTWSWHACRLHYYHWTTSNLWCFHSQGSFLGLAMLLLVQLTDIYYCIVTSPHALAFKEILTFAKARPAQMIFITTSIYITSMFDVTIMG